MVDMAVSGFQRGHEEALGALAGHLIGPVTYEGIKRVAVVGNLAAMYVVDHREPAARSGGRSGRRQRRPQDGQAAAD